MHRIAPLSLGLALFIGLVASANGQTATKVKKNANEIAPAEFQEPAIAGMTLLDALQRLRPNWMRSRGASDLGGNGALGAQPKQPGCGRGSGSCSAIGQNTAQNPPGLIVDGVPQAFETITSILAREVESARYLNGTDATTRFGTGYPNGAVLITTVAFKR